ncbi:MAG: DUF2948 family protein [Beijerinckiaceae bacterium]|nr:DUF2948 family protein [Beijerinckiaceae bacterium]
MQTSAPKPFTPCGPDCESLRLVVVDREDLEIVSCHMQDAIIRVGDMAFIPGAHRFALVAARFDWCESAKSGKVERARTGLHFDCVRRVLRTGFDPGKPETILNVLSIAFEETDAPAGAVTVTFSGGAALRLEVECLDAQMRDMGERWEARAAPAHAIDDDASG